MLYKKLKVITLDEYDKAIEKNYRKRKKDGFISYQN